MCAMLIGEGGNMNIYSSVKYREIIGEIMTEKKFLDKRFTFQAMANYLRIQKPYLSKVMNGGADFNTDQLFMSCKYLELAEEEINYLILLLEHERCTYPERKKQLLGKIHKIQDSKRDSKTVLLKNIKEMDATTLDGSIQSEYYLDPINLIVHYFLNIPRFVRNTDLIAEELFITKDHLNDIFKKLVEMNLIEIKNGKISVLIKELFLPRGTRLVAPHQQLIKQYGIQRLNRMGNEYKKNLCLTFSSNEEVRKKIEIEFNKFLNITESLVRSGEAKDCYQLNFELFPWSNPS